MIDSGDKLARQLNTTYDKYKGTGNHWLAEAAGVFVFGPATPLAVAADVWWQSSRENEAVAALQAINKMASQWMNEMSDKWLPAFIEQIDALDPVLGKAVTNKFDEVQQANAKVVNILTGVKLLPPVIITDAINSFFGSLSRDLKAASQGLLDILMALAELIKAAGKSADTLAKITAAAPYAALLVGAVIVGFLLVK
jgi:hypothetical protein